MLDVVEHAGQHYMELGCLSYIEMAISLLTVVAVAEGEEDDAPKVHVSHMPILAQIFSTVPPVSLVEIEPSPCSK